MLLQLSILKAPGMMKTFTLSSRPWKLCIVLSIAITLLLTLNSFNSYSQTKIYANSVTYVSPNGQSSLVGCGIAGLGPCFLTPTVENASNAITSDPNTFATVKSSGGLALGIGSYAGEIEIKFPATVAGGTTSFIRIDADPTLLNQLLGGNLGGLLAGVAGGVVLGNHSIETGARNSSGTTVLSGSSTGAFTSPNLRLVRDANGFFYIALRPTQDYDRVFVRDVTNAVLLGTLNNTKVYNAFYTTGIDACAPAFATGFEGTGLTLDALSLGGAGVTNPGYAIDADPTNYSELSLGALGVAGTISQNFYFNTASNAGDDFNLRLRLSSALVTAGVLNGLTVTAYNGNSQVFSRSAANLLNLDLLALLSTNQVATIPFSPGVPFDRVQVTLSSLLNVNLTQTVFIYGLTRSAGRPTFAAPASNAVSTCYNSAATLTATTPATNELRWYDSIEGGNALATTAYNGAFTTPILTANKTFYVASRRINCTEESGRVPVQVTVNPAIVFNTTVLANASNGFPYSKQITAATGGTPSFTYAIANGSVLPAGLALSSSGVLSGTPTQTGDFSFTVIATDSKGCTASANYTLTVTAALALTPGSLPDGVTTVSYPVQTIPAATGGTGPYIYSAINLPPGLVFDPNTREITGTPTQAGNYTIPVTVTDATGNAVTSSFTVKITDPLILPPATLASGITGKPYTAQTIPSATGGSGVYTYTAVNLPPGLSFNASTREISGTPTASGNYTFPVTVTDSEGRTVNSNYTISVTDPLALPAASLADGTEGSSYPVQVIPAATGGNGTYSYAATGVPPGLTFDPSTRSITGTPTQAGNYTVTVVVTDGLGATASNIYPLKVTGVLSLPTASLPNGVVGDLYPTQTLPSVSGGTVPYTYLATNLPPGLSFNTATREITGTPTTGGTYVISLTATDANNNKVNTDYTIVVNVNAPVVANATVCAGSTATLSVSNLQPGVTYNWYASTGSTALATNNSGVFVTPVISSQTTFYAEAVSGTALSNRTTVNVSVNPPANPATVTTNNQVVNSGQSTTLSATADQGSTIRWYAAPSGGTELATGANFTTPALTATTTFYVETTNASGCVSNGRVAVTVTVVTGGGSTVCNTANSQNSGITGICLLCSITGAGNSTDANPNNFTRISLAVGVTSTGYQQLIFPSSGSATDSIRLDLGLPTGLLDLSLLGNITVNVMNGNSVTGSYQLNSSILKLSVLGGSRFLATLPAGAAYDRVEIRLGGLATAISSLDIYGATIIYPDPVITSGSQTICSGNTATLAATPAGGTNLKWFDAATGGNLLASGNSFTTPALTATTVFYIEVANGTCVNSKRVPVTVTVTPVITLPVLAPIANVCSGSPATLSVVTPDPALTYRWYNVSTGGTPLFTGTDFTTPALTTNTTYYLEAANGNCTASSRVAASLTVNPLPAIPAVSASATTVSSGQSAVLTASSSETGVVFNWYDSATSTTAVFTGETFVTPPLTTNTTYYVESVSSTGCSSSGRFQITISVDNVTTPTTIPCESAISQTNGVTGVALLSGVFNPNLAIDNNAQTGSSLVMPVGALNASVYQNLSFGSLSRVGDTLKVSITSPGKLLSLGILDNIQITTFNGQASNNDGLFLNSSLLNVQLLSGNTQAVITFIPTVQFDGAELRLLSGVAGALTSVNLNYMQRVLVAPSVTAANVNSCAGLQATLEVSNPVSGFTYRWYDAANNPLADGVTFLTPALTTDTQFFVAAVSPSGCVSAKTAVNVIVQPTPAVPELLSATVNACAGSNVILQVKNPVSGVIYKWYDSNGISAGPDGTTLTVTPVVNTTYLVEAVNSCSIASSRATATVNIGSLPDAPVITPASSTIVSGNRALLNASSSIVGSVINWYSDAGATVLVNTGSSFLTPILTTNTTYYVTTTVATCGVSAIVPVTVVVIPPTPGTTDCGIATVSLATGSAGGNILAGVFNESAAVDNDVNTGSTLFIPAGIVNGSVFHRLGFTGGVSNIGDTLRIKISSPGNLLSAAVLPNLTLTTYNGGVSNNDVIILNSQLIQLDIASDGSAAVLSFVPAKQFDGVELRLNSGLVGVLTLIDFDYAQRLITLPEVSSNTASACVGSSALLSINNPKPNTTYKWYLESAYQAGKDGTTFLTDPALTAGTYNYFVTATGNNGCETKPVKVVVTITNPPGGPIASTGNPISTCPNVPATLTVQPVSGIVFNWYDAAVGGSMIATNTASFTTSANLQAGTYTYYVESAAASGCTNSVRTPISITINQNALAADVNVTGNTSICSAGAATLTASSTTVTGTVEFKWYSDAALTNLVFTGPTFTTPQISATTNYYVTVSGNNRCANTVGNALIVTVSVNPIAVAADINLTGPSTVCAGSATTLVATSSGVTNPVYTWYNDAALTRIAYTGSSFTTPAIATETTFYVTVKGTNKCENSAATAKAITVSVNPISTAADISISGLTTICANSTASLSASSATVTNPVFTWYTDAALTNAVFTGASFTTPVLTATTNYYVTVKGDNSCLNTPATAKVITVTVKDYATAADITLSNANTCSGSSVTLIASSLTVTNPVFTWYSDASLTVPVFTGPTYNTGVITTTTTFYVTVKGTNACENSAANAKPVTVNVNPLATTTDIIVTGNVTACAGGTTILTATSTTVTNPVFTWYTDAALTNVANVGSIFTTPLLNANTTYYITVKGSNKCENASANAKVVAITVTPRANANDIAVSGNTTSCAGSTTVLTASSITVVNPVFTWYSDAALTNVVFTGSVFTTPVLNNNTTYYVTVKGDNRCENSPATGRSVIINVNISATSSDIVVSGNTALCGGGSANLTASSTTVSNPVFTWYSDASLTVPIFTGPNYNTGVITATTNFYVTVKGPNTCESSAANAKIVTVTVNPLAIANDIAVTGNVAACTGSAVALTASSTTVTNPVFTWYSDAALTNVIFTGATFTTTPLTANATYYVTVKGDNRCENTSGNAKVVQVTVSAVPASAVVSTTGTSICGGDVTTLTIQNPQAGATYEWYNAATGGNLLFTGTSFTTPSLSTTTNYYVQSVGASGCANAAGRTLAVVTVNPKPAIPTVSSSTVSVCSGNPAGLSVTNPKAGVTYNWYTSATGGTILGSGVTFTTPSLTANTTFYVEGIAGNCSSAGRTSVSVTVLPVPVAPPLVSAVNGTICSGSTATLNVASADPALVYRWYATSSGGTALGQGSSFNSSALSATTTFYVESTNAAGCVSTTRTPVTVTILPVLATPVVRVESSTINSVNFVWNAVSGATGYEVSLNNGQSWQSPTGGSASTNHLVTGLNPNQRVTILVRAIGQIACQTSANSVTITGMATNPLGNEIYIPNVFTPNNDGKNDIFLVYGTTIVSVKMNIYTQWGQLIFQVDSATTGWDGTYKGIPQPSGVYVYIIEATSSDGTKVLKKGTVTLIR